ncbi:unnamed protein product [Plutella xylostella]|uniref:(diamondback moth) hypothetical protein n=1 Tax=Plutella xylostella TaxID=51655 RepID=A0A8S4D982_PLUXY|nr:unnamed protein product [Plutella xylostella]
MLTTVKLLGATKMNGLNGHSNGDMNGGDIITQNQQRGWWTIGLINSRYRYLTAETFGFKINANGTSLKKKQIWTLEPASGTLMTYLAVDSFGNVTCEGEEKEPGSKFHISVSEDGSGRWALRNVERGYFLGSSQDKLTCTAKVPGDAELWHVHLAARPQVNLRSLGRKRFAHLSESLDEIHVDANVPWGEDTLFTLEFRADEGGKYALHTCNNKYLSAGGKLQDTCTAVCLFSAEYHAGALALRDGAGAYLAPIGSKAVLKTRSTAVTRDELFSLEDSLPQAAFVANLNEKYVSVKQGDRFSSDRQIDISGSDILLCIMFRSERPVKVPGKQISLGFFENNLRGLVSTSTPYGGPGGREEEEDGSSLWETCRLTKCLNTMSYNNKTRRLKRRHQLFERWSDTSTKEATCQLTKFT